MVKFSEVLARAGRPVRLMKLNCEGAEYAIPNGVDLADVQEVCGEAHDLAMRGKRYGIDDVVASLPSYSLIDHYKNGPTTWLFYASRPAGSALASQRGSLSAASSSAPASRACR